MTELLSHCRNGRVDVAHKWSGLCLEACGIVEVFLEVRHAVSQSVRDYADFVDEALGSEAKAHRFVCFTKALSEPFDLSGEEVVAFADFRCLPEEVREV